MLTIILAAGNGQRFADAGYPMPKPLLPMPDGRPLIAWVRERLPNQQAIVARRADQALLAPHIADMAQFWVDRVTDGPLMSARAARAAIDLRAELLISYCDTFVPDGAAAFIAAARASDAPTAMITFQSTDPRYGYWTGERVIEKQVVSPWAVSGLFYFRQGATFVQHLDSGHDIPELMDAATYCYHTNVVDVGTPADYEACMAEVTYADV